MSTRAENPRSKVVSVKDAPRESGICGEVVRLFSPDNSDAKALSSVIVEINPGDESDSHFHRRREEVFHFMVGRGVLLVGHQKYRVKAGDVAYIPPPLPHKITNSSPKRILKLFVAGTPPFSPDDTVQHPM